MKGTEELSICYRYKIDNQLKELFNGISSIVVS